MTGLLTLLATANGFAADMRSLRVFLDCFSLWIRVSISLFSACLPAENKDILTRIHSEKQSKKTRSERLSADNPFVAAKKVNKPVILVDDIYTTGTTLRHAATLLKEQGCPEVYAYTLIRG